MKSKLTTAERLDELLHEAGSSATEIAKKIGVSPSLLSEVRNTDEFTKKPRTISSDTLVKLCNYFHVSADYLLGVSEIRSLDADIQKVHVITGLSEAAINSLCKLSDKERFFIEALLASRTDLYFIAGAFKDYRGKHGLNAAIDGGVIPDDYGADTLCIRNDLEYAEFTLQNRFMKFARKEEV